MLYLAIKTVITALIVVAVSEVAKRSPLLAGLLASLPLTSLLAIVWLFVDTGNTESVINLSRSILLMILPSLVFFVVLPLGLNAGFGFAGALTAAIAITGGTYWAYTAMLRIWNISL